MRSHHFVDALSLSALAAGVLIPFVYYGVQFLGAGYYPDYSFIRQVASDLGSSNCARPELFNIGISVQGVLTLIAAFGFLRATLRLGVNSTLALSLFLALAINGVQMLWAAHFPLPDPRHAGQPVFRLAMVAVPVLIAAVLWNGSGRLLRGYLVATLLVLAAMILITTGNLGVDTTGVHGLTQRIYTLGVFPVIAVGALVVGNRYRHFNAG